jgi:hypothetical protein
VVILFFGGMFVRAGVQSWLTFRGPPARSTDAAPATVQETKAPSPGRLSPKQRVAPPRPGEPEPEGFLADLGRTEEKDGDS